MKRFISQLVYAFVFIFISLSVLANDPEDGGGHVKGKVTTSDGQAAASVTVQVKGAKKNALTDEDGLFELRNLPAGTYELEVSLVGYETTTQTVVVKNKEITAISFDLKLSGKQLEEVIVTQGNRKFGRTSSNLVARLPLRNLENPQVYNTITRELLQEQMVTTFNDAVKNAPGLDKLWTSTGRATDGAAYFSLRGFSVQPSMVNGIASVSNGGLDPANIERIEVIKGPSGTLFGSSLISFGGLLNLVTKKPYDNFGGEISYTAGNFGLNRIAADINTPLDKEKNVLLRLNAAYHAENSWQDAGFKKSFFFAPSLIYKANERLTFQLNAEYYSSEATNPLSVFLNRTRKLQAVNIDQLMNIGYLGYKRSFTSNDITIKNPALNLFAQASYKLSSTWTSQTIFSSSNRKSDGYYSYVMFSGPTDSVLYRYVSDMNGSSLTSDLQQNFIGDFNIGHMRNRVVVGIDYFNIRTNNNNSGYITFDSVYINKPDPNYQLLTRSALDAKLGQDKAPTKNIITSSTYSAYISDVLNITEKLMAMLSLRVDRFDSRGTYNQLKDVTTGQYAQTAFSPKFGLVYQVVKDRVSVFANYMNGFRNVAPITQQLPEYSGIFDPQQANQFEGGVKVSLFNDKLMLNAGYYDIKVTNMTRGESVVKDSKTYNITVQDGTQRSRGFETDVTANPLRGLNIVAGYSYNDSKITKSDAAVLNRRPNSAGPVHLGNAWISYNLTKGKLKGIGLGVGGNYASENKVTNNAAPGVFTVPAYTVLNATVFYATRTWRFGVKLDNLSNEQYFKGWSTIEPQMPRRVSANLTFKF
jgi:iron complex outermembrane receptor protein